MLSPIGLGLSLMIHCGRNASRAMKPIFFFGNRVHMKADKTGTGPMARHTAWFNALVIGILLCVTPGVYGQTSPITPEQSRARIRYAVLKDKATFRASREMIIRSGKSRYRVDAGEWTFEVSVTRPATQRYHVFPKTFRPGEEQAREEYLSFWRARGYHPEIEEFGLLFQTAPGTLLDNREYWVSLSRFDTEQEAEALAAELKKESVWAWTRPERTAGGQGTFAIQGQGRRSSDLLECPLEISCEAPLEVVDVSSGFWREKKENRLFQGPLTLSIGPAGEIEIYGYLPVETYLRGVVPAEMPSSWPAEALKAQAVVARSEIYASLAGKYRLEGFDFTALESCRAYLGLSGHTAETDAVITATAGMALVHNNRYIKTVFSSCCGGWTENNENVWSGPADPMLRGVPDCSIGPEDITPASGLKRFLSSTPDAWCSSDTPGFRWQRRYSVGELSQLVNQKHRVGTIQSIREGGRGVSGRLKSVTIKGSLGTVTLEKELAIRQAFGGLPSAMVIIEQEPEAGVPGSFTIKGGGRGHGVGMCQHGARGMAAAGRGFEEIMAHYFPGARLERMQP